MPPKRNQSSPIEVSWGQAAGDCEPQSRCTPLQSQSGISSQVSVLSVDPPANDHDVEAIVRVFPWLSFFDASMVLASHNGMVDKAVEYLAESPPSCPKHDKVVSILSLPVEILENIFVSLPVASLVHLNQTCSLLRSTVLGMAKKKKHLSIGPNAVACGVLQLYPNVSSLSVRGRALPVLQQLPGTKLASSVTSLTIDGAVDPTSLVHDDLLRHLWCLLPMLQSISLRCCQGITQDCFSPVGRMEHDCELLELTVSDCCGITDNAIVSAMHRWSNSLARIKISGLKHCSNGKTSQLPSLLASRNGVSSLSVLSIFGSWKRPLMLIGLQSITRIEVSGCHSIQQFQCRCELLQELTLCDNHNLAAVSFKSSALTKLVLSGCSHLSELECSVQSDLMELNLYGCRKLVDLALQPLICGQALCNLNINGCIGLRWLKFESKVLSSVNLAGCRFLRLLELSSAEHLQDFVCSGVSVALDAPVHHSALRLNIRSGSILDDRAAGFGFRYWGNIALEELN